MARAKAFDEDRAIDQAVDCFWSRGYAATSVRDLGDAMGIGGASLYNAFGDKRSLFVKCLERYANRSSRERMARIEEAHAPKEAIRAFLAEIVERSLKDRECKGCLLVKSAIDVAPHDTAIGEAVAVYLDEIRAFFRRNIDAARRAGTVPKALDAGSISAHLLGVVMGVRTLARVKPERRLLENVVRPALALLEPPPSKPH
jgi:TetR/AcrR family transcriptional repressor of nem operon